MFVYMYAQGEEGGGLLHPHGPGPTVRAKDETPELMKVTIHWKMPLKSIGLKIKLGK